MNWELICYLLENFSISRKRKGDFKQADRILILEENSSDEPGTLYLVPEEYTDDGRTRNGHRKNIHFRRSLLIYPGNLPIQSDTYIVLRKGTSVQILNTLLSALSHLNILSEKLSAATDTQQILDISGEYLQRALFYFDSSYRVLGMTYNIDFPGDDEWKHMKEKGFLSPESIRLMQESGDLDILADKRDPFPYNAPFYPFESLVCNIWKGDSFHSRMNMLFTHSSPTELNISECRIICAQLLRLANTAGNDYAGNEPLNNMILDLLRGIHLSEELISDRLSRIPQLANSIIQVCCIETNARNDPRVLNYYSSLCTQLFEKDSVIILEFEGKIVLILHSPDEPSLSPLHDRLSGMLSHQGLLCGASSIFYRFNALRDYYVQALSALSYTGQSQGLIRFEDIYFDHILAMIEPGQRHALVSSEITLLMRKQKEYQFPLTDTLKTYLDCGCNLQLCAAKLFVHKNTALYRLNHIKELTGCDLDNAELRARLMFSFKILDKYPVMP